jgi:hypothetical protein
MTQRTVTQDRFTILGAVPLLLLLLLSGCSTPKPIHVDVPAPPVVVLPDPLRYSWNTTEALGPSTIHVHVDVPKGAVCSASLKASMHYGGGYGPTHLIGLKTGADYAFSWNGAEGPFRLHSPAQDTKDLGLQATEADFELASVALTNSTVPAGGIDAYVAANLTPLPADPHHKGADWWQQSLNLTYSCNQAAHVDRVDAGKAPLLFDYRNAAGGVGFYARAMLLEPAVDAADFLQFQAKTNVTLFALAFGSATVLQVQTPTASPVWTFDPVRGPPYYTLNDGPGLYTVHVDHAQSGYAGALVLGGLQIAPVSGLDALLPHLSSGSHPSGTGCSPHC